MNRPVSEGRARSAQAAGRGMRVLAIIFAGGNPAAGDGSDDGATAALLIHNRGTLSSSGVCWPSVVVAAIHVAPSWTWRDGRLSAKM
jgi:hypothetical protein